MSDRSLADWLDGPFEPAIRPDLLTALKTPGLSPTVSAFLKNARNCYSLSEIPLALFNHGIQVARADWMAKLAVSGRPELPYGEVPYEQLARQMRDAEDLKQCYLSGVDRPPYPLLRSAGSLELLEHLSVPARDAIANLMVLQVVSAWTAFETLAGDLWEAALNLHPQILALLRGTSGRIEKQARTKGQCESREVPGDEGEGDTDDGDEDKASGRKASLEAINRLTKGAYDLSGMMGTLLRREFSFRSLYGIRTAYSCAFDQRKRKAQVKAIDAALSDLSLYALSRVRNLIVHRGLVG
jgi:hypothetical protein